jgi:hypothetical protein
VEVDRAPLLVLGHLGERDPDQPPQLPSVSPASWAKVR